MSEGITPDRIRNRLIAIELDSSIGPGVAADTAHERRIAIHDLVEANNFSPCTHDRGPYRLVLGTAQGRLIFDVFDTDATRVVTVGLGLSAFRRLIRDYFILYDNYYTAIRDAAPSQIETVDMARRALHNEASELLIERLKGKIDIDFETARRLFTLISVLSWRG